MKKMYQELNLELIRFSSNDVIVTSGDEMEELPDQG